MLIRALIGLVFAAYVLGGMLFGGGVIATATAQTWPLLSRTGLQLTSVGDFVAALPNPSTFMVQAPLRLIPDWQGTERVNVLLLGTDQREDERKGGIPTRTDVMLVVSIDPVAKTALMVSFPRDMWVAIPGFGEQRINVAYAYGENRKVPGGGAATAAHTVELNFGLSSSYYALVNFEGFEQIIDTLGGVVIDVPRPLKDDEYPTPDYRIERIFFQAGPQIMTGSNALKYARSRHSDSDFARNSRQRAVLLAIRDRALRINVLANLPALLDRGMSAVQTNFSTTELLSLAKLAGQIDTVNIRTLGVEPPLVRGFTGEDGASLQLPDRAAIKRAIQQLQDMPAAAKSP
ncbi:MAG: LytR family transcriptional regulator [Chloroflexi bacterium]|nr:LytR family transcriptional regulator [Chloroflexota bacterium]